MMWPRDHETKSNLKVTQIFHLHFLHTTISKYSFWCVPVAVWDAQHFPRFPLCLLLLLLSHATPSFGLSDPLAPGCFHSFLPSPDFYLKNGLQSRDPSLIRWGPGETDESGARTLTRIRKAGNCQSFLSAHANCCYCLEYAPCGFPSKIPQTG